MVESGSCYEEYDEYPVFFEADSKEEVNLFLLKCFEARNEFFVKNKSRSTPPDFYKGNARFEHGAFLKWKKEVYDPWVLNVHIPFVDEMNAQFWNAVDILLYMEDEEFKETAVQTLEEYVKSCSVINTKEI
jgi:hypothetical protein